MKKPYKLESHLCRISSFYALTDSRVPSELFSCKMIAPDLEGFPLPLPSKKSDYVCSAKSGEIEWYGAKTGLVRYDKNAVIDEDKLMYFSAPRDLQDNNIKAILPEGDNVWVLTDTGAVHIEMKNIGAEEKADILLAETLKYVSRRGMMSQKAMAQPGNPETCYPYGHSDNDGTFTVGFAIGEIFRYVTFKREKGADHPDTIKAKKIATEAVEVCLLLLHVHGRGNGFAARTYLVADEPVPDDGLFFRKTGGKAYCLETTMSKKRNCVGYEIDASAEIPARLSRFYTDLGYTDDDIIYKADTSSDEITHHFLVLLFAHLYLVEDDAELSELIKSSVKGMMNHIIDNGYQLVDYSGEPTTWAKWNEEYFASEFGWVDACLNSAELLMYHLVTMEITGEQGKWKESYDYLVNEKGYADLPEKHFDRLYQATMSMGIEFVEDIMYGDHMLAICSFWGLCTLEKNEELLEKYRKGFKSWRSSLEREHNPGYDLPFAISCPDEEIDLDKLAMWFYRTNASRLASGVSLKGRHDIPVKPLEVGHSEISVLLPPDERFISKYDRNPLALVNEDSGGNRVVENCYVYTFAYWIGRYFGFFE